MKKSYVFLSCTALVTLNAGGRAYAQAGQIAPPGPTMPASPADAVAPAPTPGETGTDAAQAGRGPQAFGDIVVTARRRAESLQRVPISITAFSDTKLKEQAIYSVQDLNKAVPGLAVTASSGNPGVPSFAIRGRGQQYGAAAGSVESYFADVPLSGSFQAPTLPVQFFDLQSFQVLKGPQGTLFGRSTTGGAVLVVPQAPTYQFEGYGRLQAGTFGDLQAEGAINVPIVEDKVSLRIAGFRWKRKGYSRTFPGTIETVTGLVLPSQRTNSRDEAELRATLLLDLTDQLTNSTIVTYHTDRNSFSAGAGLLLTASGAVPARGYGTRVSESDVRFKRQRSHTYALINTTTFELSDSLTIKNIFGYINAKANTSQATNADGTARSTISLPATPRLPKNRQVTEELQFQGNALDDRLTWIVGGLIDKSRQPGAADRINMTSSTIVGNCTVAAGAPCNVLSSVFSQNTIDSYGLFGSATYKFTPELSLTGAYRHSWDKVGLKTGSAVAPTLQTPSAQVPSVLTGPITNLSQKFEGDTYNVDLSYNASARVLIYGGYRRGYKRGGFNQSQVDVARAQFAPETIDDFYLGLKNEFELGAVPARFNIEGFYDLYKGQQVSYLGFSGAGQLTTTTTNIDKTTFRGFDADFSIEPAAWLIVSGNYAFTDAYHTKWVDRTTPTANQDLTVNPQPFVSRNKATVTGRLHTDLANGGGELAFATTVSYQDSFVTYPTARRLVAASQAIFGNIDTLALGASRVPNYALVDLRLEWNEIMGSKFSAAMNVTNLTKKDYFLGNSATIIYGVQGNAYGPPRMFTFDVSAKF